ncbi:MAG: efflux RND transporter periplasmic adaptor subunit [Acidobacteriales bacterium]|nr:efflux RND transporter periplasmic adaptor subunit [Terriglobales bacterium]
MTQGKKFVVLLAVISLIAIIYYLLSTNRSDDLVLIGTVDANEVVVSPKITGRIEKLTVDEGSEVKAGDLIAELDSAELAAQRRAAASNVAALRSRVAESRASERLTKGTTTSEVANAQARLQASRAAQVEAQAELERIKTDHGRIVALAREGVVSEQERDQLNAQLKAQQARVVSMADNVSAAEADLKTSLARTHQAEAAQKTVEATRAQMLAAEAEGLEAEARLGYARVLAPVSGTVSVRVAREGEVVGPGSPIVTIIDLGDTWVRAPLPETYADRISLGDTLKVRLPSGQTVDGKVIFKAVESDFATQRDVGRRKRDIKTFVLKLAVDNREKKMAPGMTAEVLVPKSKLEGK